MATDLHKGCCGAGSASDLCSTNQWDPSREARCRVERSLLWEITGSLAAASNDLRVGKELLFSKPKIVVK